jgi:methylenetetrahydrofolate dehydrogenase (NADP+)/methenyltetrahydrofolate cyclohydrolase
MASRLNAQQMDGAALSREILGRSALRAAAFAERVGRRPCLAAVLVGHDPASVTYIKMKQRECERVGVDSKLVEFPEIATTHEVVSAIEALSFASIRAIGAPRPFPFDDPSIR